MTRRCAHTAHTKWSESSDLNYSVSVSDFWCVFDAYPFFVCYCFFASLNLYVRPIGGGKRATPNAVRLQLILLIGHSGSTKCSNVINAESDISYISI